MVVNTRAGGSPGKAGFPQVCVEVQFHSNPSCCPLTRSSFSHFPARRCSMRRLGPKSGTPSCLELAQVNSEFQKSFGNAFARSSQGMTHTFFMSEISPTDLETSSFRSVDHSLWTNSVWGSCRSDPRVVPIFLKKTQ